MNENENEEKILDFQDMIEADINRIGALKPSERSFEEWLFLARYVPSTMEEKGFPFEQMTARDWKGFILDNPIFLQYGPPVRELLKILKKKDFRDWESYHVCQALLFEGDWLAEARLLPLSRITQEDFDTYFGAEACSTAEEFWELAPGYFPTGFPRHIRLPYPRPEKEPEK